MPSVVLPLPREPLSVQRVSTQTTMKFASDVGGIRDLRSEEEGA